MKKISCHVRISNEQRLNGLWIFHSATKKPLFAFVVFENEVYLQIYLLEDLKSLCNLDNSWALPCKTEYFPLFCR